MHNIQSVSRWQDSMFCGKMQFVSVLTELIRFKLTLLAQRFFRFSIYTIQAPQIRATQHGFEMELLVWNKLLNYQFF